MNGDSILVIKHGALGDIILATAAFKAIRRHYPDAHITLLTSKPYAGLLAQSPYFNDIWTDSKPKWYHYHALAELRGLLNRRRWNFVYDLQCSRRTRLYPWLFRRPWPSMSTSNRWVSHPRGPYDVNVHAMTNLGRQLAALNIEMEPIPDLTWLSDDVSALIAPIGGKRYALLVPGGAAHRLEKRWPAEHYASLAAELVRKGITPMLIGTDAEKQVLDSIATRVPQALNVGGKTSIAQVATLARGAALAVGNDTGPMHVIAAAGCPSTVLFSRASDPIRSAPVGASVTVLREMDISQLVVDRVLATIKLRS